MFDLRYNRIIGGRIQIFEFFQIFQHFPKICQFSKHFFPFPQRVHHGKKIRAPKQKEYRAKQCYINEVNMAYLLLNLWFTFCEDVCLMRIIYCWLVSSFNFWSFLNSSCSVAQFFPAGNEAPARRLLLLVPSLEISDGNGYKNWGILTRFQNSR